MKASVLVDYAKMCLADDYGYIWGTHGELWTQAKQEKLEKTTDPDRESSRKYGRKWIGHMVTDCSGMIYEPCRKAGVPMPHGSNTMYLRYCRAKGKLVNGKRQDGKPLLPGTAVFTYNSKTGKYGHVGLYIGDGLCIEAKGAQYGVVTSKPERWGYWGELKNIEYDGDSAGEAEPVKPADPAKPAEPEKPAETTDLNPPTLKKGSKGEYVTLMQTLLNNRGYKLGSYGIDGSFGPATEAAVKQFQRDWGLKEDGIAGPETWKHLQNSPINQLYCVTIYHLTRTQAEKLKAEWPESSMTDE